MISGKKSIHKRFMLLLLSMLLLAFLVMSAISLQGLWSVWQNTQAVYGHFAEHVMGVAEELAVRQTKAQIWESATEKARQVERQLNMLQEDTEYIAASMQGIMAHPERYSPRHLPAPFEKNLSSGEAYIMVSPKVRPDCSSEAALRDMALSAHIADDLEVMAHFYQEYHSSCFVGSKYGYLICADIFSSPEEYEMIHSDSLHRAFDPRERPWYQKAASGGKAVFTDLYMGTGGFYEITCAAPYYDSAGLAGVAAISMRPTQIYNMLSDKSLGSTAVNFVLNAQGEIMFSSAEEGMVAAGEGHRLLAKAGDGSLALAAEGMTAGASDIVLVVMDGEEYYLAYAPLPSLGWSFGTMLKRDEVMSPVVAARENISAHTEEYRAQIQYLFLENTGRIILLMLVLLGIFFYGSRSMTDRLVQPIQQLTEGVGEIAKGRLDTRLHLRTGDEIEELADSLNQMTENLQEYMANIAQVTADKQQIDTEMSLARNIQEGIMPNIFPKYSNNPHYDLSVTMNRAKEVGGDFYDFYNLDENHVALTVAEVSGCGVPGSLFMVITKTMLKNDALAAALEKEPGQVDWAEVMARANRQLCENNEEDMLSIIFFCVLNIMTGEFIYVNGGHKPPLIGRCTGGEVSWSNIQDQERFLMLGYDKEAEYKAARLQLQPGDMLCIYSNGVPGARDSEGNLYTEERLQETFCRVTSSDARMEEILEKVSADIKAHTGDTEQLDDITMLGIRFLG